MIDDEEDDNLLTTLDCDLSINNPDVIKQEDEVPSAVQFTKKRKMIMLIACYLLYMTSFIAFSTMAPFYTTEALKKGSTKTISGAVFAASPFVMFFVSPMVGRHLTTLGPIFVLLSGAFLEAGCEFLFGFLAEMPSTLTFVLFSFLIRIVMAIGSAFTQTAILSIISFIYQENISFIMGLFEFASGIGFMIGPAIGGFLFDVGGFRLPFLALGSVMFLLLIMIALVLPWKQDLSGNEEKTIAPLGKVLRISGVWLAMLIMIYCGIGIAFFDAIFAVHLSDITQDSVTKTTVGLLFLSSNAIYAIASAMFGYFGEKCVKSEVIVFLGLVFCFLFYSLIGPAPYLSFLPQSFWLASVSFSMLGIGWAPLIVFPFKLMQNAINAAGLSVDLPMLSFLSGLITACYNIGAGIGPLYGGFMLEYFSFQWATLILAIGFLVLGTAQVLYILKIRKNQYTSVMSDDNIGICSNKDSHTKVKPSDVI